MSFRLCTYPGCGNKRGTGERCKKHTKKRMQRIIYKGFVIAHIPTVGLRGIKSPVAAVEFEGTTVRDIKRQIREYLKKGK